MDENGVTQDLAVNRLHHNRKAVVVKPSRAYDALAGREMKLLPNMLVLVILAITLGLCAAATPTNAQSSKIPD